MDKKTIIIIFLTGLVIALVLDANCIIDWIPSTCQVDTLIQTDTVEIVVGGAHCNDNTRYDSATDTSGGGMLLSMAALRSSVDAFKNRFTLPENQRGVLISKRAIDAIFDNNETANCLICYFGLNAEGKIHLIFEPKNSFANMISTSQENLLLNENSYFISESTCPEECGAFY